MGNFTLNVLERGEERIKAYREEADFNRSLARSAPSEGLQDALESAAIRCEASIPGLVKRLERVRRRVSG